MIHEAPPLPNRPIGSTVIFQFLFNEISLKPRNEFIFLKIKLKRFEYN